MHGTLDKQAYGERHRLVFDAYFADALQGLAEDGLMTLDAQTIQVTSRGRLLLRIIAMCFDEYLGSEVCAPRYSRTI